MADSTWPPSLRRKSYDQQVQGTVECRRTAGPQRKRESTQEIDVVERLQHDAIVGSAATFRLVVMHIQGMTKLVTQNPRDIVVVTGFRSDATRIISVSIPESSDHDVGFGGE